MKSEVKKLNDNKREISIEASEEAVKNKFDSVFENIAKEAKVPGFRPGNAPRDIIEKNFSQTAHDQVLKELIPELYSQALEKEGLEVVDYPQIVDVKLDRQSLSFKANVEIYPEINLKDYKKIKIKFKKIEVSDDELKRSLDAIKESKKLEVLDDNVAKSLSYPNMQELESVMKMQIALQKDNQQRHEIERTIIDTILKDLEFKIPDSLVNRQLEELTRQAKMDLALKGVPREKIEEYEKKMIPELEQEARQQVRVYLVLAAIAKKENIANDDHMPRNVMELLLKEANWQA